MTDECSNVGQDPVLSLIEAPLASLLQRLGTGDDAATGYEQLRFRLITYFRLRFPADADALADEAIDRLARRLTEGTQIANIGGFALGIARFIVLETSARRRREQDAAREALVDAEVDQQEVDPDPAQYALRLCLESLGTESAALIVDYYGADSGAAKIARRQALALKLGLSVNALRNRALRIRMTLEKCVKARLETTTSPAQASAPCVNHHTAEHSRSVCRCRNTPSWIRPPAT